MDLLRIFAGINTEPSRFIVSAHTDVTKVELWKILGAQSTTIISLKFEK